TALSHIIFSHVSLHINDQSLLLPHALPVFFGYAAPAPPQPHTLSLRDALPIFVGHAELPRPQRLVDVLGGGAGKRDFEVALAGRSEEHTSELQSRGHLVCRLLLEKKKEEHRSKFQSPAHDV